MAPINLRIEGVYPQRQEGYFMQRVKLPAGVISAAQARTVADTAAKFGRSSIHLTSRGCMEIHWLEEKNIGLVKQEFAKVGLTSRGACGGAVRGVTCSSHDAAVFPQLESLARRLHRHFTGNPRYEALPKKFKIGIEAATGGGRHLIQDVGLVLAGCDAGRASYDLWVGGGLGREPRPGFLLAKSVSEAQLIPKIEAIIAVYARLAPPPKRLKFLATEFGEDELRRLIEAEPAYCEGLPPAEGFADNITLPLREGKHLSASIFAGQLTSVLLSQLADFADKHANGVLQVTANQDIAFVLEESADVKRTAQELSTISPDDSGTFPPVTFRVCPGSHECKMGLAATRDIAKAVLAAIPSGAKKISWALSGCANSCTQPQLADVGIIVSRLVSSAEGVKSPRFDLYQRHGAELGESVEQQLSLEELITVVQTRLA